MTIIRASFPAQAWPERLPAVPAFPSPEEIRMTDRPVERRPAPAAPQGDPQPPPLEDQPRPDEVLLERTTEVVPEEPEEAVVEAVYRDPVQQSMSGDWQVRPDVEPVANPHRDEALRLLTETRTPYPDGGYVYEPDSTVNTSLRAAQVEATLGLTAAVERLADIIQAR